MIVIFSIIGAGFGLLYFIFGSAVQFLSRARGLRCIVIANTVLFLLLGGSLVFAGVTARYSESGYPEHDPDQVQGVVAPRPPMAFAVVALQYYDCGASEVGEPSESRERRMTRFLKSIPQTAAA